MKSIHVLVTDDHLLFRKGLIAALQDIRNDWKFYEASNGVQAADVLTKETIDVVLMDVQMPVMGGYEAVRSIRLSHPDVPILVLTQFDETSLIVHFLQMGISGYLSKNNDPEKLIEAIEVVFDRGQFINDEMVHARELADGITPGTRGRLDLSNRDKEIILLLKQGKSSKQIAFTLGLSETSVESYRKELLHKTRTRNVAELVSFVHRTGLI